MTLCRYEKTTILQYNHRYLMESCLAVVVSYQYDLQTPATLYAARIDPQLLMLVVSKVSNENFRSKDNFVAAFSKHDF